MVSAADKYNSMQFFVGPPKAPSATHKGASPPAVAMDARLGKQVPWSGLDYGSDWIKLGGGGEIPPGKLSNLDWIRTREHAGARLTGRIGSCLTLEQFSKVHFSSSSRAWEAYAGVGVNSIQ